MARYLFFCEEETGQIPVTLGKSNSITYTYFEGLLTVYRYGVIIYQAPAKYRKAYEVISTRRTAKVKKINIPEEKVKAIAWLCGVPYWAMATSDAEYEEILDKYYSENKNLRTSAEWYIEGSTYKFMWNQKKGEFTRPYCISCFISEAITLSEIMELVPLMREAGFPDWYLLNYLGKTFHVTKEMYEEAIYKKY